MKLPPRADVVVIGAGLTGASTALHLAECRADLDVVVVEAGTVATGASGRGTGLLGPRLGPPIEVAVRRDGPVMARQRHLDSESAVRLALDLAHRHAPEAVLPVQGQQVVAGTAAEAGTLRRRARTYASLGLAVTLIDTDEPWAADTRTALAYGPAASVEPAALTRGLVAAAQRRGVLLVEQALARSLEAADRPTAPGRAGGRPGPIAVHTDRGTITTRAVVVAVDVSSRSGRLPLVAGQLPLQVSASATAPLPPDLLAELGGPTAAHVIAADPLGPYRRLTRDGRVVIGGGPAALVTGATSLALEAAARRAWDWQRAALDAIHPALGRVHVTHRWSGRISLTRDGMPRVGRLSAPGLPPTAQVWAAGGWNGHGLAATVEAGHRLAGRILADDGAAPGSDTRRAWPLAAPWAAPLVRVALHHQTPRAPQPARGSEPGSDVSKVSMSEPSCEETHR